MDGGSKARPAPPTFERAPLPIPCCSVRCCIRSMWCATARHADALVGGAEYTRSIDYVEFATIRCWFAGVRLLVTLCVMGACQHGLKGTPG
jgi:hypothetical protein